MVERDTISIEIDRFDTLHVVEALRGLAKRGEKKHDFWAALARRLASDIEQVLAPEPVVPTGPIVHAVMYRDHKMGTICNSGAWGTPELFTAVTEHVTCPACLQKLEGGRAS